VAPARGRCQCTYSDALGSASDVSCNKPRGRWSIPRRHDAEVERSRRPGQHRPEHLAYSNRESYAHTQPFAHGDSNGHTHGDTDTAAHGDPHPYSDRDADTDAHGDPLATSIVHLHADSDTGKLANRDN
jgi:hypothetical protein